MKTQAEWSLMTKFPGDAKDYRILSGSAGGLDVQGIRKWLTGEVPLDANSYNPAAPWYLFGVEGDQLQQILIRQEWTDYADFSNRPILITTCLLLPFVDVAKAGCGFGQLVELFDQEDVKAFLAEGLEGIKRGQEKTDFDRLDVNLPGQEETLIRNKQIVDEIGYDSCVMASDALLRGPLCLVQTGGVIPPWQDRLKWLDAALVLLPYGLRADCSTTLWASSSAPHAMRLYWGRESRQGHAKMMIPARTALASMENQSEYFRYLSTPKNRMNLKEVLGFFIKQWTPYSFASLPRDILFGLSGDHEIENKASTSTSLVRGRISNSNQSLQSSTYQSSLKDDLRSAPKINSAFDRAKTVFKVVANKINTYLVGEDEQFKSDQIAQITDSVVMDLVSIFSDIKTYESINNKRLNSMLEKVEKVLLNGQAVSLFEQLLKAYEKVDKIKRSHRKEIFLKLLQGAFQKSREYELLAELARWVGGELPEDFWYVWVNVLINGESEYSVESLKQCLGQSFKNESVLIFMLRVTSGLIKNDEIDDYALSDFRKKPIMYPIWLIQFATRCGTLDKVLEPVGRFLLKEKDAGKNLRRQDLKKMLAELQNERLTDNGKIIFDKLSH